MPDNRGKALLTDIGTEELGDLPDRVLRQLVVGVALQPAVCWLEILHRLQDDGVSQRLIVLFIHSVLSM